MTQDEQELVNLIHRAFTGVTLEDGESLNMTEYNDSGGCMPEFKERARGDERDDCAAIPHETLEKFTVTFSFTDLKGYRFYIPAYMIWTIKNHRVSESIIADFTIYALDPSHYLFENIPFWQWFSTQQVDAMIKFLEYALQNEDSLDGKVARNNLSKIKKAQQPPSTESPSSIRSG